MTVPFFLLQKISKYSNKTNYLLIIYLGWYNYVNYNVVLKTIALCSVNCTIFCVFLVCLFVCLFFLHFCIILLCFLVICYCIVTKKNRKQNEFVKVHEVYMLAKLHFIFVPQTGRCIYQSIIHYIICILMHQPTITCIHMHQPI